MLYTADLSVSGVEKNKLGDVVEALISQKAAYVINKTNTNISVNINGITYQLGPYAVEVFNFVNNP
jgi:hypothetical protein